MSTSSRSEYFQILSKRYQNTASKIDRSAVIDEACANTKLHRKSVIRALKKAVKYGNRPKLWGRPKKLSEAAVALLKQLYRAAEYHCAKKLKAMMQMLLDQRPEPVSEELKKELLGISAASMDRYLGPYRKLERRRKNSLTRPGSRLFKKMVPLKNLTLITPRCGFMEGDTVAHCGGSLIGEFIWSLTVTDQFSGWTKNQGVMGKSSKNVLPAIKVIVDSLPFEMWSFNVDNGSEFLNDRVYEYFLRLGDDRVIPFPMTRSRSYQKNDNPHVEQKNWTTVRQIFGYDRFDFKELLPAMNEVYRIQNLITNFFIPQFKIKSKVRIQARIQKKYDKLQTPFERVLADPTVSDENKQKLRETYGQINYYTLIEQKEASIAHFIKLQKELKQGEGDSSPQFALLTAAR